MRAWLGAFICGICLVLPAAGTGAGSTYGCPELSPGALQRSGAQNRGVAGGDIDGDGGDDLVLLDASVDSTPGCRFQLVVVSRRSTWRAWLGQGYSHPLVPADARAVPYPRLLGIVDLGLPRGNAIVVITGDMPHQFTIRLYAIRDNRLQSVRDAEGGPAVFAIGSFRSSFLEEIWTVDCLPGRPVRVVSSTARHGRTGWRVTRTIFELRSNLWLVRGSPHTHTVDDSRRFREFRTFGELGEPFPLLSCLVQAAYGLTRRH